jgi:hypothetical protein
MPFNADGSFTPVTGATTAQAGDVIRSSTWDSINTDYATAFSAIGRQLLAAPRVITVTGNITATTLDFIILIQTSVPILNLPASSTRTFPLKIMGGATGVFSVNTCVLTPNGADKISGLSTVTLNVDYQVVTLYPLSSGGYLID